MEKKKWVFILCTALISTTNAQDNFYSFKKASID
jgi:hypothetical protein